MYAAHYMKWSRTYRKCNVIDPGHHTEPYLPATRLSFTGGNTSRKSGDCTIQCGNGGHVEHYMTVFLGMKP